MIQLNQKIKALLLILFLGFLFHKNYITEFPSFTHAWAQSDHYALALGFVHNNLNFFEPETFILNHQFRKNWKIPAVKSITAVDFPIHNYIPALVMKLSGYKEPLVYRMYILLYSCIGLYFLFRIAFLLSGKFYTSLFVMVFAATSPVFVYYQGGFLPTIPSLANAFIGTYFYLTYITTSKNRYFNLSLIFFTLAALSRTTFAIPLIAFSGTELLRFLQGKTSFKNKFLPVLLSFSILLFYFLYNSFLRENYGSLFLNQIRPAGSIHEVLTIFKTIKEKWGLHYFSIFHYLILFLILVNYVMSLYKNKAVVEENDSAFCIFISLLFLGSFIFMVLMLRQFRDHDYYFLDTFFLPVILAFCYAFSFVNFQLKSKLSILYMLSVLAICTLMVSTAWKSQKSSRITGFWDRTSQTISNFKDSEKLLDSLKISKNAKFLVIDAYAPNIPFILMNRKGYALLAPTKESIEMALPWDFEYVAIQNDYFISEVYPVFPDLLTKLKKVHDNGKISICTLNKVPTSQSLEKFLGIANKIPGFQTSVTFDTIADPLWQNTNSISDLHFSGAKSGMLTKNMEYGIGYKSTHMPFIKDKNRLLLFSSQFYSDRLQACELVVSITENGKSIYYNTYDLRKLIKTSKKWEKVDLLFHLPQVNSENYEFALFIYNTGKTELNIDDFGFKIY